MSRFSALSSLVLCVAQSTDGQHLPSGSFDNVAMLQSVASSGRVTSETDDAFIAHSSSHAQFWPFTARAPAVVLPKVDIAAEVEAKAVSTSDDHQGLLDNSRLGEMDSRATTDHKAAIITTPKVDTGAAVTAKAEPIFDDHHGVLDVIHRAHFHRAHKAAVVSTPQAHTAAAVDAKVEPIASNHHGMVDDVHHGVMRSDALAPHQYQHRLPNFRHGPPQSLQNMLATEKLLNAEAEAGLTTDADSAETDIGSVDEGEAKVSVTIDAAADAVVGAGVAARSEDSSSKGDGEQSAVAYDDSAEAGISADIDEVSVNSDGELSSAEDEVTEAEAVDSGDAVDDDDDDGAEDDDGSDAGDNDDDDVLDDDDNDAGSFDTEVDTTSTGEAPSSGPGLNDADTDFDSGIDEVITRTKQELTDAADDSAFNPDAF